MEKETLEAVEWPRVMAKLAEACRTERARAAILRNSASTDLEKSVSAETVVFPSGASDVERRGKETDESRALLDVGETPPLGGAPDIGPLLDRALRGDTLDPQELLDVRATVDALRGVSRFLGAPDRAERCPILADLASVIETPTDLDHQIAHCIDADGQVRDAASPALAEARKNASQLTADLTRRLDRYLQNPDIVHHLSDRYYTIRNDRYVLPVKADARGRVKGIVHDASRSGTTLFVEPEGSVDLNNQLKRAELEIKREIDRVLRSLSREVATAVPALRIGIEHLTQIDLAFARGSLSQKMSATSPRVGREGIFELPGLRHPLIEPDECVPNDVRIGRDFKVLVVSGPNAGGKTVTLKATALAALLVRAGMHVPCEMGARVDLVETVIADIGDGQDIGASLSTFSAHMARQARILSQAGPGTLVILDEIGTGTDPGEGASLAQAILERLAEADARVLTTTHFGLLKEMADLDPRFANASVEFDAVSLGPTYRLRIGEPGVSAAAAVAARMGMPTDILERADALQNREDRQLEKMLSELSTHRATLQQEQNRMETLRAEGEAVRDEYRIKLERLQARRDDLYQSMRSDLDSAFQSAHGEIARVIRELQADPTSQRAAEARKRVMDLQEKAAQKANQEGLSEKKQSHPELLPVDWTKASAGDRLRTAAGQEGVLISLPDRKGRVGLQVGTARILLPSEKVGRGQRAPKDRRPAERIQVERAGSKTSKITESMTGGTAECDLRGLRVEEAMDRLQELVDRAVTDERDLLRVIHGHGSGALRQAVREHLAESAFVTQIRPGEDNEGGEGVTFAALR